MNRIIGRILNQQLEQRATGSVRCLVPDRAALCISSVTHNMPSEGKPAKTPISMARMSFLLSHLFPQPKKTNGATQIIGQPVRTKFTERGWDAVPRMARKWSFLPRYRGFSTEPKRITCNQKPRDGQLPPCVDRNSTQRTPNAPNDLYIACNQQTRKMSQPCAYTSLTRLQGRPNCRTRRVVRS